jgi:translation initiation factor 2B subunit (eIF-2B alpha/beta/delta family)
MLAAARIEALARDREHGASFLARRAVEILVESAAAGEDPLDVAGALADARPAMGAIAGAVGRVVAAANDPDQIVVEGRALLARSERAARSIAVLVAPYVGGLVLTHSTSATVAEVLRHAGAVETSEMSSANVVVVGADTVFRDGSVVNAAGTCALAKTASRAGVPVIVAAETIKLVPADPTEPEEEGFDLTPADLIDRIATEEGIFPPADILALVDRSPFLRAGYDLVTHAHVS